MSKKEQPPMPAKPGWQIRCTRCDYAVPLPKRSGKKFRYGRCPNCKHIRFMVVESVLPYPEFLK